MKSPTAIVSFAGRNDNETLILSVDMFPLDAADRYYSGIGHDANDTDAGTRIIRGGRVADRHNRRDVVLFDEPVDGEIELFQFFFDVEHFKWAGESFDLHDRRFLQSVEY